jgi:hypothetical protein
MPLERVSRTVAALALLSLAVRPHLPAGARDVTVTLDGARAAWRDSAVEVALASRSRGQPAPPPSSAVRLRR